MKRTSLLLLLAALLVVGCRSTRQTAGTDIQPAAPQESRFTAMTFSGQADGYNVTGQVRMAKDSILWCSVTKLVELGRAMATPDSIYLRAPLMALSSKGDYATLRRKTGVNISFAELQDMLESPDAEQRIAQLAKQLGHSVTIRITKRVHVDKLTFPFNK